MYDPELLDAQISKHLILLVVRYLTSAVGNLKNKTKEQGAISSWPTYNHRRRSYVLVASNANSADPD